MRTASAAPSPAVGPRKLSFGPATVRSAGRWVIRYDDQRGLIEWLRFSPLGLLVAIAGRLGRWLRTEAAPEPGDGQPGMLTASQAAPPSPGGSVTLAHAGAMVTSPGGDAVTTEATRAAGAPGRWREVAIWVYLCGTLAPTFTLLPARWVDGSLAWRLAAAAGFPALILVLVLAYAWAAPALDGRCRRVTGTVERCLLRAGYATVAAVRAEPRDRDRRTGTARRAALQQAALQQTLWELAGSLVAAERVRAEHLQVRAARRALPADDPLAAQLRSRQAALARERRALWTEVVRRFAALRALAATPEPT